MAQEMNQNLAQQVEALKREVEELKRGNSDTKQVLGRSFIESIKRRIGSLAGESRSDAVVGNIDRTISFGEGGGSEQVLDYPDGFLQVDFEGVVYNIPYYNEV